MVDVAIHIDNIDIATIYIDILIMLIASSTIVPYDYDLYCNAMIAVCVIVIGRLAPVGDF